MKKKYSKTKVTLLAILGRWILSLIYKTNRWDVRGQENYKSELDKKKSAQGKAIRVLRILIDLKS